MQLFRFPQVFFHLCYYIYMDSFSSRTFPTSTSFFFWLLCSSKKSNKRFFLLLIFIFLVEQKWLSAQSFLEGYSLIVLVLVLFLLLLVQSCSSPSLCFFSLPLIAFFLPYPLRESFCGLQYSTYGLKIVTGTAVRNRWSYSINLPEVGT